MLAESLMPLYDIRIVAPRTPQSGVSKSLTFDSVLRKGERGLVLGDKEILVETVSGTPADCVMFALSDSGKKYDLLVSGVNFGDNTTYHSIFSSGTLGACFQASLYGLPAVAFSYETPPDRWFCSSGSGVPDHSLFIIRKIISKVLDKGFPSNTKLLSVNLPAEISPKTPVRVAVPQMLKLVNNPQFGKDPTGNHYFWLGSIEEQPMEKGKDWWWLSKKGAVVITPLKLDICPLEDIAVLKETFED